MLTILRDTALYYYTIAFLSNSLFVTTIVVSRLQNFTQINTIFMDTIEETEFKQIRIVLPIKNYNKYRSLNILYFYITSFRQFVTKIAKN